MPFCLKCFFSSLLLASSLLVFSQNEESNIIDLSRKFQLHIYGKQKFTDIIFIDQSNNRRIIYSPNDQMNFGLGFNYRFLGFGVAFNFKFVNNDDDVYGDTRKLDLQMNGYGKKSVIDLTFFFYKSFYIENPDAVFANWQQGDSNYIRSDLAMASFGLSYLYVFNNKQFSYKAAFVSNAVQKKSAGSFFLGGQFNFSGLVADSSFLPAHSDFDNFSPLRAFGRNAIGLNFGYAYNLILPKYFYISASFALAPNIGFVNYSIENQSPNMRIKGGIGMIPRFALGYNGMKFYTGFSFSTAISNVVSKSENLPDISWQNGNLRVFLGRRFN